MDGWISGWAEEWIMDAEMDGWTYGQTEGWTDDACTHG